MNATQTLTTASATLSTSVPSLPTRLTTVGEGHHVYVPQPGLTGVPSGYARQAQLESARTHAFRPFNFYGV